MSNPEILDVILLSILPLRYVTRRLGDKVYELMINEREISPRRVKLEIIYPKKLGEDIRELFREAGVSGELMDFDGVLRRVRGGTGGLLLQIRGEKTYIIDPDTSIILFTTPRIPGLNRVVKIEDLGKYLESRREVLGKYLIKYIIEQPETLVLGDNIRLIYIVEIRGVGEERVVKKPLSTRAVSSLLILSSRKGFEEYNKYIGKGLVSFINSTVTRSILKRILLLLINHRFRNLLYVETPLLAKKQLYIDTGHLKHFKDRIYSVHGRSSEYFLRPMNCPHHLVIAKTLFKHMSNPGKTLPLAIYEFGTVFRDEPTGTLEPLIRVRQFTLDDLHVLMPYNTVKSSLEGLIQDTFFMYKLVGIDPGKIEIVIGVHDPGTPSKYLFVDLGVETRELWRRVEEEILNTKSIEELISNAAEKLGLKVKPSIIVDKTAAFYGPKLDFYYTGCSRYIRLSTFQLDVSLPRIFGLHELLDINDLVLLHGAIAGSLERFLGIILEENNFLPSFLSPIQALIIIHEELLKDKNIYNMYEELKKRIEERGLRTHIVITGLKKLGTYKNIALNNGINYLIVIGPREISELKITLQDLGNDSIDEVKVSNLAEIPIKLPEVLEEKIYSSVIEGLEKHLDKKIPSDYIKHLYTPLLEIIWSFKG